MIGTASQQLLSFGKDDITCPGMPPALRISTSRQKVIIWWSDLLYPHEKNANEIKCGLGNCTSFKRKKYHSENVTIAYIFYGTDFDGQNLPLIRKSNHIWALLHEESPSNNFIFSHSSGIKLFNYSATFSRQSDFPLTTQFIPSVEYLTNRKPVPLKLKNKLRKEGLAPVLYLQSHCNVASDRDQYVKHLMNYIPIDSYGKCLHNKDLPPHLASTDTYNDEELFSFISQYKFHIAFENAICNDYITEKLFRALHVGSVPIYKGSASVKDWLPTNKSAIVVDDFNDPSELADFVLKLDQNDSLYNEFLQFKETGIDNKYLRDHLMKRKWGVNDPDNLDFIRGFECFICDKIQKGNTVPSIANLKHMNCPQPHQSLLSEKINSDDEWMNENWIEDYWFALDQAKAIEMMIHSKERHSSNFMKYLMKIKHHDEL
ncbi:Fucosyltransferase 11 like protein [Argiope bruennichi]|uniref:Fucosyltransferase n=1 Tax=Argiope bruennichi TaxID=94029 RepID=A0A8T0EVB7_ARGBR|nr:Fucosyltransferase 11 like protein [Argiope bruennichi]